MLQVHLHQGEWYVGISNLVCSDSVSSLCNLWKEKVMSVVRYVGRLVNLYEGSPLSLDEQCMEELLKRRVGEDFYFTNFERLCEATSYRQWHVMNNTLYKMEIAEVSIDKECIMTPTEYGYAFETTFNYSKYDLAEVLENSQSRAKKKP